MTLGDKLSKLRRENNYTQEQLAELLNVSRQAISKWESNISYPETDKLIRIGTLFNCSLDYLLKEECETPEKPQEDRSDSNYIGFGFRKTLRERKSSRTLWGLPPLAHCQKRQRHRGYRSECAWCCGDRHESKGIHLLRYAFRGYPFVRPLSLACLPSVCSR